MRFSRDRRGQSVVIGTVILFGFLILALSLYQVQIVPQQNAQVEFQHFEEVRNDLVELRAGILQAGSTDRPQYQTVRLGTSYSTRLFAINPPAPAGTIRTTDSYNITIDPDSGDPINVSTRFIQYQPGYNEIDQSPTWYDASVLYTDASDNGGGIAVIEGQELVDNGENVSIVAVQNEFQRSGTGRVTVELRPAESVTNEIPDGQITVTIPTRLSEDNWESKTNITDKDAYVGVTDDNNDGIYDLELSTTAENLTVDTVGVQETPKEPTQNANGAFGGGGSSGDDGNDGGSDDANSIQTVDGTASNSGNSGQFRFDITVDNDVTVDSMAIETRNSVNNIGADDGSTFTIDVTDGTSNGASSTDGSFDYIFDPNPIITPEDGNTRISFNSLDTGVRNVEFATDEASADIVVSLQFTDGSVGRFYLNADEFMGGGMGGNPNN